MVFLRRFASGLMAGFVAAPSLAGTTVALCEEAATQRPVTMHIDDSKSLLATGGSSPDKTWGVAWLDDWDQPATLDCEKVPSPSEDPRRAATRQRQILLIRHGQYENESSRDDSVRRLTRLGRAQATATGTYLGACFAQVAHRDTLRAARREAQAFYKSRKELLEKTESAGATSESGLRVLRADVEQAKASLDARRTAEKSWGPSFLIASRPANIYVSNLLRAQQTAELILDGLPHSAALRKRVVTDADLRERFPCDPQPIYPGHVTKESDMETVERAFARYFHRPERADATYAVDDKSVDIIVGHGNLIRYFALRALQLPPEAWLRQSLMHASITSIVISDNGKVKLSALGSFGHLAPELVTVDNIGYNASGL